MYSFIGCSVLNPSCPVREYLCYKIRTNTLIVGRAANTIFYKDYRCSCVVIKVNPFFYFRFCYFDLRVVVYVLALLPKSTRNVLRRPNWPEMPCVTDTDTVIVTIKLQQPLHQSGPHLPPTTRTAAATATMLATLLLPRTLVTVGLVWGRRTPPH